MPSDKEIEEIKEKYPNMMVWGVYSTGYREESQLGDIPVVPFYDVVDALKDCEERVIAETVAAMQRLTAAIADIREISHD